MASIDGDTEMSSGSSTPQPSSLERLSPTEINRVLLPHILRFAGGSPPLDHPREIIALVDSATRSVTFIEGSFNSEAVPVFLKEGPLPATKASIEAIPVVRVLESGVECTICLSEFGESEEAKELPCGHMFHSGCVEKWLQVNGSCPVCRYKMPVEEEERREKFDLVVHVIVGRHDDYLNSGLDSDPAEPTDTDESAEDQDVFNGID